MRGVVDLKAAAGDRLPRLLPHVHTLRGLLRLKVSLSLTCVWCVWCVDETNKSKLVSSL